MLIRLVEAVFAPKYPRHYRGRHRASTITLGRGAQSAVPEPALAE